MKKTVIHEIRNHGSLDFPYTVYHGLIPEYITCFPLHWHDEIELVIVLDGTLNMTINGKEYIFEKNDVAVVLPKVSHSFEKGQGQSSQYYNILFNFSIFSSFTYGEYLAQKYLDDFFEGRCIVDAKVKDNTPLNDRLRPLLTQLAMCRHESYTTKEMFVMGNLFLIMHYLNEYKRDSVEDDKEISHSLEKVKDAIYIVQNRYSQNLTVDEVASLCGFSESHFMKLFKDLSGESFTNYLINYRLRVAAKLLTSSDSKILDIAVDCGFNNQSYFTRAFTKKFGVSPFSYRKSFKN